MEALKNTWYLTKNLISMEKINLSEFQENSLAITEMLSTSGGSGESSGTVNCQTKSSGGDSDHKGCDTDW